MNKIKIKKNVLCLFFKSKQQTIIRWNVTSVKNTVNMKIRKWGMIAMKQFSARDKIIHNQPQIKFEFWWLALSPFLSYFPL